VRRSSDNALKSFTADEITDGTLLSFVGTSGSDNGFVKTWYDQSVTTQAGDTATGNHATQATAANQPKIVDAGSLLADGIEFDGSNDRLVSSNGITVTTSSDISFSLVGESDDITATQTIVSQKSGTGQGRSWTDIVSSNFRTSIGGSAKTFGSVSANGTPFIYSFILDESANTGDAFKDGSQSGSQQSISAAEAANGELVIGSNNGESGQFFNGHLEELIVYLSDQTDNRVAIEANMGEVYSIDLPSGVDPGFDQVDGFVETWYDQSGNGNNATQATAGSQPKIVNAGTFLSELDFDGTDDTLDIDFGADLSQASSFFIVHQSDTTTASSNEFFDSASSASPRTLLDQSGSDYRMFSGSTSAGTGVAITTDKSLIFALYNGSSSLFAKNGTATSALNAGTTDIKQNSTIGSSNTQFYDGSMQEFIIYNTDQTDNRPAIEANINNQYDIY
jgi:hypothetical protein